MHRLPIIISIMLMILICFTSVTQADIGVGVDLAKISIDEKLIPGDSYHLPTISVINTGNRSCDYQIVISSIQDQPQIVPSTEWFHLQPDTIRLDAGGSQKVEITLTIPLKAQPGEYFALIEASPVSSDGSAVAIGIAAATKLYFTVRPANFISSVLARISSWIEATYPTFYIILAVIVIIVIFILFRKYFRLRFRVERK